MAKTKKKAVVKRVAGRVPLPDSVQRRKASGEHNIRNWRLFRNLKQAEVARLTVALDKNGHGLERVTIIRLETGQTRYNEWHLGLLSKVLNTTPHDLIRTNPFDAGDIFTVLTYCDDTLIKKATRYLQLQLKIPRK